MESLFNYESDEDSQEKGTDELDANYDHVAMDMSSDDEGKPSQLENKTCLSTTVESSELSFPNYISCSSDESHGLATTNTTRSQSLMDENNTSRKRKSKMKEEEEEGRLSPCSSTSSNSKKSRYHSSHGIGDVKSMENRYNSTNIARHQHNESARFDAKASHQGSSTKYTHSHSRRYSREWDGEKRYRPRSGDSPSCNDERSESRTSVQNSPVQKFIGDHPSQMRESSRDLKIPNNCNRMAANPSRYADQVQKRKLLWSGENKGTGCDSKAESKSNHWQDAKFSQDTDGRLRAKFKRLMGMKATEAEAQVGNAPSASSNDLIKKQEEMFNSMEMQYEVARVSTHTHRGLGLGFGVHQFPR